MTRATVVLRVVIAVILFAALVTAVGQLLSDDEVATRSGTTAPSRSVTTSPATSAPTLTSTSTPPSTAAVQPEAVPAAQAKVVITGKGIVAPVIRVEGTGWRVRTPCGNEAVVSSNGARALASSVVVIDPGHGGGETGATSPDGLREKDVNLAVAQELQQALAIAGVTAVLTRANDYRVTLDVRAEIAKALAPAAFISIHHNAEPDGAHDGPGSETYYQYASSDSKRLAGLIYEEVVRTLRGFQVDWVGDTDAGAKYRLNSKGDDYYGILRRTHGVPAVLAELAFITNPSEAMLMRRADFRRVEADAVARGVVRFLTTKDPGSGFVGGYQRTTPAGSGGGTSGCLDPPLE